MKLSLTTQSDLPARPSLLDVQQQMLKIVFGGEINVAELQERKQFFGESSFVRVNYYRELCHVALGDTLDSIFETAHRVMIEGGRESDWAFQVEQFLLSHPPRDRRLNWIAKPFIKYFKGEPWLRELAQCEWLQFESISARDPEPHDYVNPSLKLHRFRYAVPVWYQKAVQVPEGETLPQAPLRLPKGGESHCAFFRDPITSANRTLELTPQTFGLLQAWLDGSTPVECAQEVSRQARVPLESVLLHFDSLMLDLVSQGILIRAS